MSGGPERRFADALDKAREEWAAADAAACAARAGGEWADGAVRVVLFGRPHLVTHPGGEVVGGAGRAGPRRRPHPAAPLPAHGRRHAAGRGLERLPRAAGRAVLRGIVRAEGRGAAGARLRRVRGGTGRVPRRRTRGRRGRAHAGRRVVPLRRPAARGRRRGASGPATTRSPGRPACSSTQARATTSRPRTSPASAASLPTGSWRPRATSPASRGRGRFTRSRDPPLLSSSSTAVRSAQTLVTVGTCIEAADASWGSHDLGRYRWTARPYSRSAC